MNDYSTVDQMLHEICQIIAKFNRTFVPKEDDDSHTNLSFEPLTNRIYGRWVKNENQNIILCLELESFQFELLNDHFQAMGKVSVDGKNIEQVQAETEIMLNKVFSETKNFSAPMHYEIGEQSFLHQPIKKPEPEEIAEWSHYRNMANQACFSLQNFLQHFSEIRIWPHHFDTGIYIEASSKVGIGFGLAKKDQMAEDAYFYFVPYSLGDFSINFKNVPQPTLGKWIISENWNGVVFRLKDLEKDDLDTLNKTTKQLTEWVLKNI